MTYLFGNALGSVKSMDTSLLNSDVVFTNTIQLGAGWYWQPGVIRRVFSNFDYYILNGETRSLSAWVFSLIACAIGKRKKVFFWSHGWYGKETKMESLIKKILFHLPGGGVFLYGNYARKLMIKEGFNSSKLFVIHNSLDYERQLSIRLQLPLSDIYKNHFGNDNKIIIVIGRLNKRKQLPLLLKAVQLLSSKGEKFNVVFVGDGDERKNLEELTVSFDLQDQVWFYGACYDEKKNGMLIFNSDICVMPGDIGLTAIHCLTFGTPCITHDNFSHQGPEFEAIHSGETGDFFKHGNLDSLATIISRWFRTHQSREIVRTTCYKVIDDEWTPQYQMKVLKYVLGNDLISK